MNKNKKTKKKQNFTKRLIAGNLGIVTVLIVLLFSAFFLYYSNAQEKTNSLQLQTVANTAVVSVENSIDILDTIALQLSANNYIYQQMEKLWQSGGTLLQTDIWLTKEVDAFVWSYLLRNEISSRICLYNAEGSFISVGSTVDAKKVEKYTASIDFDELSKSFTGQKGSVYMFFTDDPLSDIGGGYVSVLREIKDLSTIYDSQVMGYVEVQMPIKTFEKQIEQLEQGRYELDLYVEKTGEVLVGDKVLPNDELQNTYTYEELSLSSEIYTQRVDAGYQLAVNFLDENLTLVSFDSAENFINQLNFVVLGGVILFVAMFLIIYFIQNSFVSRITKPLFTLFEQVEKHGFSHKEYAEDMSHSDELEELQNSFNSMLTALHDSSELLNGAKIGQLRAQLLALQAQLDPHFIHNTLSVMVALAQEGNNEMVEQVAYRLSDMIRYSTSFEEPLCSMEQEIRHLENYLELLAVRYEDNFKYEIKNNVKNQQFKIPRFITQPIAENSLAYSLKQIDYPWKITVECESDDYFWRIIIDDNGKGISQEKSNEIMKQTYDAINKGVEHLVEELKIGGLSLLNINARLFLNYKEDMIFCVMPNSEGGTRVIIGGKVNAD